MQGGKDVGEVVVDGEGVSFVVGVMWMTDTGGTHGEWTVVPKVGHEGGGGGERSEDVGGVGGDVLVETGGEGTVGDVLDGEGDGGGVWDRVRRGESVEETEVDVVIVEGTEERTGGDHSVGGVGVCRSEVMRVVSLGGIGETKS